MNKRKTRDRKKIRETKRSIEAYRENSRRVRKQNTVKVKTIRMFDDKGTKGLEVDVNGKLKSLTPLFKNTNHEVIGLWQKNKDVGIFDLMANVMNELGYLVK